MAKVDPRQLVRKDEQTNPVLEEEDDLIGTMSVRKSERTLSAHARMFTYIEKLKELPDDSPFKRGLRFVFMYGLKPVILIFMFYVWLIKKIYCIYKLLPQNVLMCVLGIGLCFFGGGYFASIAFAEAVLNMGGPDMWNHFTVMWDQGQLVGTASLEDDKLDANENGIEDVKEMSCNDLISHKAKVAAMAVTEPDRLEQAVMFFFQLYVAVLAMLKSIFARTVMLALGVANMISLPLARIFGPFLAKIMGDDLIHWVPTIIDTTVKVIAVIVAAFVQEFISGFNSALRGGKLFAEGAINILSEKGVMDKLPNAIVGEERPFNPDKSYLDECIGYPLAAFGFYYQVINGFKIVPFPLNIIVAPLAIAEYCLRFEIFRPL